MPKILATQCRWVTLTTIALCLRAKKLSQPPKTAQADPCWHPDVFCASCHPCRALRSHLGPLPFSILPWADPVRTSAECRPRPRRCRVAHPSPAYLPVELRRTVTLGAGTLKCLIQLLFPGFLRLMMGPFWVSWPTLIFAMIRLFNLIERGSLFGAITHSSSTPSLSETAEIPWHAAKRARPASCSMQCSKRMDRRQFLGSPVTAGPLATQRSCEFASAGATRHHFDCSPSSARC
jgi:hypothetical protein